MSIRKTIATATLLALPATALVAASGPASADAERRGACGTGRYEFSVDREGPRYEVALDLDRLGAGTRWQVVLRHNGRRLAKVVRTADREGDLEVERVARNKRGRDTFAFTARRADGSQQCGARVRVR
ncbi:hypothetical protein [Nocardioides sp. 616]|uniref:hypothetical protein n=1 Tax=Nocardioides sp. 616 TaxID=2268090 RepID=UPI000CE4A63A|nr:hypothetical protein [Nocardioides sp. 616]